MSNQYQNLENPFKYPELDWYTTNDMYYFLDLLTQAGFGKEYLDFLLMGYNDCTSNRERDEYLYAQLIELGVDNVDEFGAPINAIADLLNQVEDENFPKVLYLVTNPDQAQIPTDFNAFNYPDYFKYSSQEEEDYSSREVYNEVLKKALDVRNNNLDARKFNTSLTTEQVVALATNKLKVMNTEQENMVDKLENDLNFSPNSIINSPVSNSDIEAAQELTSLSPSKLDNLLESKKKVITQKPQYNLNDLLNKEE